jgi:hypothetical protein
MFYIVTIKSEKHNGLYGEENHNTRNKIFIKMWAKVSCIFGGKEIKYTYPPQDGYLGYANKPK